MKQARIGVVGYCPPTKYDADLANDFLDEAFTRVAEDFSCRDIVIVSGATNVGVISQAYLMAEKYGFRTSGVACEKAADFELFKTSEKPVIVGDEWGSESDTFLNGVSRIKKVDLDKAIVYKCHPHYGLDAMIRIGTGPQSLRETEIIREKGLPTYEFNLPKLD